MAKESQKQEAPEKRVSSRTRAEFPRDTLESALRVPQAIEDANGGQPYPPTETALAIGVSPGSSDFRTLLSSSLRYGLTRGNFTSERISLEQLGRALAQPQTQEELMEARVKAALTPEIFRSIYEYYRGKKIPEGQFLQNTIVREFGISKDHAELCAKVFLTNMEYVSLVRAAPTGKWLSSTALPSVQPASNDTEPGAVEDPIEPQAIAKVPMPTGEKPPHIETQTTPPNQRVFITHGKNKAIVAQLKDLLAFGKYIPVVAEEHETPSKPVPEKVLDDMRSCFAGVIHVASEEELLDSAGVIHHKINENVLIEIGAAMALYGKNYILLVNKGVHLPSNLQGLYVCFYEGEKLDYDATMKLLKAFSEFK